jgi:hypothetical protein
VCVWGVSGLIGETKINGWIVESESYQISKLIQHRGVHNKLHPLIRLFGRLEGCHAISDHQSHAVLWKAWKIKNLNK